MNEGAFSKDVLSMDFTAETERLGAWLRATVKGQFRKRGVVVGLSGGIDSSAVAAISVNALGADRVFGILMPERDSESDSLNLGRLLAEHLGIKYTTEEIAPALEAVGCYERRDAAIKTQVPAYGPGWKNKIVLPSVLEVEGYRLFSVVVESPDGERSQARLSPEAYFGIVAATNFKQRTRTMLEYYHADRLNFAVAGTPNLLEYDQGFFVKGGDGLADVKPIAHLYKTQVYGIAGHLGVPDEILRRPPTTDTYSLPQSQDEFFFSLPYAQMDLCLYARDREVPAEDVAAALDLTPAQVLRVYQDIDSKRKAARYLHSAPLLVNE